MFHSNIFAARREKLTNQMPNGSIAVLFSGIAPHMSRDAAHIFHVNRNFFYLSGIAQENSALLVNKLNGKIETTLFTEHVDPVEEKWTGKRLSDEQAQENSGVETVKDIGALYDTIGRLLSDAEYCPLFLDLEQNTWNQDETAAHRFARLFRDKYPGIDIRNAYQPICRLRSVKDTDEVNAISEAIRITKDGIENMWAHARPDMKEYEIEAHFNFALKSQGVKEHAFPSIIAGGERATVLHYVENDQTVEDGSLVLCDLGAAYNHYAADITRTFPVNGKFSERQRVFYEIVLLAMDETIAAVKPGVTTGDLNNVTKATLARELKRIGLIQTDEEVSQYYYHGVSHPLGLDTHDVGAREWPLEVGAVITIEPGLYIAEEQIGIRIEDDVLVTENGSLNLAKDILKRVDDIEAFMASKR